MIVFLSLAHIGVRSLAKRLQPLEGQVELTEAASCAPLAYQGAKLGGLS